MTKTVEGQLRPLHKRKTPQALVNRDAKILARRTVADHLNMSLAQVVRVVNIHSSMLSRGFFGRLKWLVMGK